ncbi:hypothetical protein IAE16_06900 [Hydrogenobacter sp. T-2]|uniref:hypothetical protein n=1 Tax=Pampinifervens diazotrophicum TaxID=1632018 RepID=UPI002B25BCE5|nr:hypothetical protein [Hydrogenobacter sp. T-2]WPM31545.1 hypothetical protein IAE16_06900 [Hydrogenobacter sp. T-2]
MSLAYAKRRTQGEEGFLKVLLRVARDRLECLARECPAYYGLGTAEHVVKVGFLTQ